MRSNVPCIISRTIAAFLLMLTPASIPAQIGGQTGIVVLDDVEDLDLNAFGVNRDWISESIEEDVALSAIEPTTIPLTLAPGQTPAGVFRLRANRDTVGYFEKSAGVPLPSQSGASTLTSPGNLTYFDTMEFVACTTPTAANMELQIILECYPQNPDLTYPKLYWVVSPQAGTTFAPVTLDLHNPDLVENANGNTVPQLLSQTRFLAFYIFAGPAFFPEEVSVFFDDITFVGSTVAAADRGWHLYE